MKRNTSVEEEFFAYGEGANRAHNSNNRHFKTAPAPSPFSKIIHILLIIVLIALLIVLGIIGYMYAKKAFAEHQGTKSIAAVEKKKQYASTTASQSSLVSQGVSSLTTAIHSEQSKSSSAVASFASQSQQAAALSFAKSPSAKVQSNVMTQKVQSASFSSEVAQSPTSSLVSNAMASVQMNAEQTKKITSSLASQKNVQEMSNEELIKYLRSLKPDQLKNIDIEKLILGRKKSSDSQKKVAVAKTEYLNNQVVLDEHVQKKKKEITPGTQLSQKLASIVKASPQIKETKEKKYIEGLVQEAQTREAVNRYYIVAPGDTLSKIAKRFYGKSSAYVKIYEANQDIIKDPKLIFPGQKLRIPKY